MSRRSTLVLSVVLCTGCFDFASLTRGNPDAMPHSSIVGIVGPSPASVDLSAEGRRDWANWGRTSVTDFDHKAGVTPQISNYTVLGTFLPDQAFVGSLTANWTGGTPTASASSTGLVFVDMTASGNGFEISVAADTTPKTLRLYTHVWAGIAKLEATLSDGSAPAYVETSDAPDASSRHFVYAVRFNASTDARTLTVKYTGVTNLSSTSDIGDVDMQCATLQSE